MSKKNLLKKSFVILPVLFIGLSVIGASVSVSNEGINFPGIPSSIGVIPDLNFGKFPLYFIFNKGQVNEKAVLYAKTSNYTLWLTKEGLIFDSTRKIEVEATHPAPSGHPRRGPYKASQEGNNRGFPHSPKVHRDVSTLFFLNANTNPEIVPINATKHRVHFFLGNDKSKWHCDVPTSQAVLYKKLYKKIDLRIYGIEREIEYDWIVKPGGNPGDIRFEYKNLKGTQLDEAGNLLIETDFGELMHKKPVGYQQSTVQGAGHKAKSTGVGADLGACPEARRDVNVTFKKIAENTYGFEVGDYDKNADLIIDPVILLYSTYLGGTNNEYAAGIAVGHDGDIYITGNTFSTDFPTLHQYQEDQTYVDAFLIKIDTAETGTSSLVYSTYLGGENEDEGRAIAVDNNGIAYIIGSTGSPDFPILNQYQTVNRGSRDVFVIKIDTTQPGESGLLYSTYLGGEGYDEGNDIAVDQEGIVYLTGEAQGSDFPILNQFQNYQGGAVDAFVTTIDTKKSGAASLVYSTFLGGNKVDVGSSIAVDSNGNVYITGYTLSPDFPTLDQYQADQPQQDAFVTKINPWLGGVSSLIYSTYLGGSDYEWGSGIAVDNNSHVYVTGSTYSNDFPTLNQYQTYQNNSDAFITRIDTTQSGTSGLIYSTYLGGGDADYGIDIAIDQKGNAYLTGLTYSRNLPILHQFQKVNRGKGDAFVTNIDTSQTGESCLVYSTYLGGEKHDKGYAIAVGSDFYVYVCGETSSTDFPILNQYQGYQRNKDCFVTKFLPYTRDPFIELNRTSLQFAAVSGQSHTDFQTLFINNPGGGTLNWIVSSDTTWIKISPSSGTNSGVIQLSLDIVGLQVGTHTGIISVQDDSALNSPQTVAVTLKIYSYTDTPGVPFGFFSTPAEGATVYGSVPVTGWALDNIGIRSLQIFREEKNGLIFIGDAVFVEGARPDIEQAYPNYPNNYKAGWGYLMLTNFLPNGGNGTFKITAIATDMEGNQVTLGTKTIICDNANAVKPFGTIDTPTQGGTASGNRYVNFGWALTPQPNTILTNGSTITVWVDGERLGNPVYNKYREDIASLFPGYNNSDGAVGYYILDTTQYQSGVHTIAWSVKDDAGNIEGIGSRFFTIQNSGLAGSRASSQKHRLVNIKPGTVPPDFPGYIKIKKGFCNETIKIHAGDNGNFQIEINECEPLIIECPGEFSFISCNMMVGNMPKPKPIGSTIKANKLCWWPTTGFNGTYNMYLIIEDQQGKREKINLSVKIFPKFTLNK